MGKKKITCKSFPPLRMSRNLMGVKDEGVCGRGAISQVGNKEATIHRDKGKRAQVDTA